MAIRLEADRIVFSIQIGGHNQPGLCAGGASEFPHAFRDSGKRAMDRAGRVVDRLRATGSPVRLLLVPISNPIETKHWLTSLTSFRDIG